MRTMNIKSFYVYMIHLSKDVLIKDAPDKGRWTSKKFIKKNPQYDLESKIKPCVYIGYSSVTPEERYVQHKERIPKKKPSKTGELVRNWNPYAAEFGIRLEKKKKPFKKVHKSMYTAKKHEQNLANYYRKKGYAVWGGQKEK